MSLRKEEWRDLPGYDGFYQVSDWGRLRSFRDNHRKGKKLKTPIMLHPSRGPYHTRIVIKWEGKQRTVQVGQAVALAFIGEIPEGWVAYHKDGNFENNALHNIGIAPRSEVSRECMRQKVAGWNRKPVLKINRELEVVEAYPSGCKAAKANGFHSYQMWLFCALAIQYSVFAPDDFIYTFDDDKWIRKALDRAKAELDAMGIRYNDPFTECYYDLPAEDGEIDLDGLQWADIRAYPEFERGGAMKGA